MDAKYFLFERTKFIRYYYDFATMPFLQQQADIQAGKAPYDNPSYDESGEPPFLTEWMDAQTGIEAVGLSSVSLLSESLRYYFEALQRRVIGFSFEGTTEESKALWKKGFVAVYKEALGEILGTDWSDCPVRFEIVEQIVLARNCAQHNGSLTSAHVAHDNKTLAKYPSPFFSAQTDIAEGLSARAKSLFPPAVEVTRESLLEAITEVEKLGEWIEGRNWNIGEWRMRGRRSNSGTHAQSEENL